MRNTTTDRTQESVSERTLTRRIMRAMNAAALASESDRLVTFRLEGYESERAKAGGEGADVRIITVTRAWHPGTGRASVNGPVTKPGSYDGEYRTLNLYKASRIVRVDTPASHRDAIAAQK